MMDDSSIADAVLEADAKIKAGKVKIETTKNRYMGGVIKNAKRNVN